MARVAPGMHNPTCTTRHPQPDAHNPFPLPHVPTSTLPHVTRPPDVITPSSHTRPLSFSFIKSHDPGDDSASHVLEYFYMKPATLDTLTESCIRKARHVRSNPRCMRFQPGISHDTSQQCFDVSYYIFNPQVAESLHQYLQASTSPMMLSTDNPSASGCNLQCTILAHTIAKQAPTFPDRDVCFKSTENACFQIKDVCVAMNCQDLLAFKPS
jgi:hypothetical protein